MSTSEAHHDSGVPATELSDEELTRQGSQAHATRSWVFLHGTADQFRHHTERMLEIEQEFLRRFPKRTWQRTGGADGSGGVDLASIDLVSQVRSLTRTYNASMEALLAKAAAAQTSSAPVPAATEEELTVELLRRYATAPEGRLHKLEAHHVAREIGLAPAVVAKLYKAQPPLLVTAGEFRQITPAGRARIEYA
jgi:hypothetical protein